MYLNITGAERGMLNLTVDEREKNLKKIYPNLKRYTIDFTNDFLCWWDMYDMPMLAMFYLNVTCKSPDKPKDLERWKSEHYVGRTTNVRWDIIRKER